MGTVTNMQSAPAQWTRETQPSESTTVKPFQRWYRSRNIVKIMANMSAQRLKPFSIKTLGLWLGLGLYFEFGIFI